MTQRSAQSNWKTAPGSPVSQNAFVHCWWIHFTLVSAEERQNQDKHQCEFKEQFLSWLNTTTENRNCALGLSAKIFWGISYRNLWYVYLYLNDIHIDSYHRCSMFLSHGKHQFSVTQSKPESINHTFHRQRQIVDNRPNVPLGFSSGKPQTFRWVH